MTIQLTTVAAFDEVAADPGATANAGKLYTKDVATITELFYQDSAGNVSQLTPSAGTTPWQRTGTTVALDQAGDLLVVPFDATTTNLGSTANRWASVVAAKNVFPASAADPALIAAHGQLYAKTDPVTTEIQLYWETEVGTVIPITPNSGVWQRLGGGPWDVSPRTSTLDKVVVGATSRVAGGVLAGLSSLFVNSTDTSGICVANTSGTTSAFLYKKSANVQARIIITGWGAADRPGGMIKFGPGTALPDISLTRIGSGLLDDAVGELCLTRPGPGGGDPAGGASNFVPGADAVGNIGTTSALTTILEGPRLWSSFNAAAGGFNVRAAGADVNAKASLTSDVDGGTLLIGAGAAAVLSAGLKLSAVTANTIEITNGALLSGSLQPRVTATGTLGTTGVPSSKAFQSVAVTSNYGVYTAAANPFPVATLTATASGGSVAFGPSGGAATPDVEINWSAPGTVALKAGASSGSMIPFADTQGSLGVPGVGGKIFASMAATSVAAYASGTDTEPKIQIATAASGGILRMGAGVAATPDTAIQRTATTTITIDNNAGGAVKVIPGADLVGQIGTTGGATGKIWASVVSTSVASFASGADTNPKVEITWSASGGMVKMSAGGTDSAADVRLQRTAATTLTIDNNAGGAVNVIPGANLVGQIGTTGGATGKIWASVVSTSVASFASGADTNPKVELTWSASGGMIKMSAGGTDSVADTRIQRTAAITMTVDDNAGGRVEIIPALDGTNNSVGSFLGTGNFRFSQVNTFELNTGDIVFTDPGCAVCGRQFEEGDDLVMRVIKTHDGPTGRRTRTVPAHQGCK